MKVIRNGSVPEQDATNAPLFLGGKVSRQPLVEASTSKFFSFGIVSFAAGARNKLHTHTSDQILLVTKGRGIVATEKEQVVVKRGDVAFIPAGEKHWHGATPKSDFAHISLTHPESKTQAYE